MYEEFFGLRARPFGITPSTDLFFHSSAHRRALAGLRNRVLAGEPLVALIGSIGAGKTTVLQALLRELPDGFAPAMVVSTQLDEIELTRSVLLAFGAVATGASQDDLRAALRYHLTGLRWRLQRGLLVVDEAQNFSAATLRYLMRLPELGIDDEEGSLRVIISGQPGLESLLAEAAGGRGGRELPLCRLRPLSTMDTGSYVRHRLRVVGTMGGPTFSEDALDLVRVTTGGLPRLVNRLCDRVLVSACLDGTRDIDSTRVARAAAELREELDEPGAPFELLGDQAPTQVNLSMSPPAPPPPAPPPSVPPPSASPPPAATVVGADLGRDPVDGSHQAQAPRTNAGNPPSQHELSAPPTSDGGRARTGRHRAAVAVAGLLALSVAWTAYDRSSRRDTTLPGTTAPPDVAVPAIRVDPTESRRQPKSIAPAAQGPARTSRPDGQSAVGRVQEPARPPSQALDARAALGLAPATEPTTAPPPAAAPVASDAAGPILPSCSDAAKALGLCS